MFFYTFLAYLEGPQNQKNSKFIEGRRQKSGATKYRVVGGQNHAGEVFKFKFRSLCLICALLHLSSIPRRPSKQKNSKFVEGRSQESGATKYRVVGPESCRGKKIYR